MLYGPAFNPVMGSFSPFGTSLISTNKFGIEEQAKIEIEAIKKVIEDN